MESYMESQDSYSSLFEDKSKYNAIMNALAGVIYREMRVRDTGE
jgi:type I restriction enzyme R subunit